jgi:hypothetical protein
MHPWYADGFLWMAVSVAVAAVAFLIAGRNFNRALAARDAALKEQRADNAPV